MNHARSLLVACALLAPATAVPAPRGEVVRVEHVDPSTVPTRGPASALVTVELFFAPTVLNVQRLPAYRMLEQLQAKHPTRIRIVYRVIMRGAQPPGPQLPTLALEAYAQGKFFEFVGAVHATRMSMTRDQLIDLGQRLGLDPTRLDRAISDGRYRDVIAANEQRLDQLHATSAPAVFFNDKPMRQIQSATENDYEAAYNEAYNAAVDMIDRGVDPKDLTEAFDAEARRVEVPVVSSGFIDDDSDPQWGEQPLADPPLRLEGLPSLGAPGSDEADTPLPVVMLCRPNATECSKQMRDIHNLQMTWRGEIKIVWAPWFEVGRDDAADLAMLGDAALCAEASGSSPDDLDMSPGWAWVTETYSQMLKAHSRRIAPDKLIDDVAARLHLDTHALSACRARMANTTLDWVTAAHRAGVSGPAMVIGGRIYHNLTDGELIKKLVEAELAPGVLGRCSTTGC